MASIVVCCRTSGEKSERVRLSDVNTKDLVMGFRSQVSQAINVPREEIELVYCGRLLRDESTVDFYNIHDGSTVHALRRTVPPCSPAASGSSAPDQAVIKELITSLQKNMKRPDIRQALEKLLTTCDITDKLTNTAEFENDPVAIAILREPSVLAMVAESPENITKAIQSHPGLVSAMKQIMDMASKEAINLRLAGPDTEEEALAALSTRSRPRQLNQPPGGAITHSQLSAALAAATASSSPSSSSSDQPTSNEQMRALFQAHAGQEAATASQNFEQQMLTLRGMGITDETIARNALRQTGGNIGAALDLIFGESSV